MDTQKIDLFLTINAQCFESHHIPAIREKLLQTDESKWQAIQTLPFKKPAIILIVSILVGSLGVDRFLIGDVGLGVLKLLTCGGVGIWTIIDWFIIMSATKEKNVELLYQPMV